MKKKIVDEILAADKAPPEAAFNNTADMLAHLNDTPSGASTPAQDAIALAIRKLGPTPWSLEPHRDNPYNCHVVDADGQNVIVNVGRAFGEWCVLAALRATSQTPDAVREACAKLAERHNNKHLALEIRSLSTPSASASPQAEAACMTAAANNEPCKPARDDLKRCAICGFIVDTSFEATKPTIDFTMAGRTKTKDAHPQPQQADGRWAAGKSVLVDQLAVKHLQTWGADLKHAVMLTAFANELLRTVPSAVEALASDFENSAHHVWDNQEVADRLRALQQSPATDNAPAVGAHQQNTAAVSRPQRNTPGETS